MTDREVVHQEPAWRDRSNFIIAAEVKDGGDTKTEQLWARQVGEHRFEICCIPFFVYDLALGDVVDTDADYIVRHVVEPSAASCSASGSVSRSIHGTRSLRN